MRYLRLLGLLGVCLFPATYAHAQRVVVGIGVGVPAYYGPAPVCAYGYYGYYPYGCAPYGYYGPEWFVDGVFIGAGPWFHGFYGRPYGYYRHGFYGPRFHGRDFDRGFRGEFRGGFHERGEFRGREFRGGEFHGGGGFHGEGRFHGGGRGGGRR